MEPSVADGMTPRCHIPRTELSWNVGSWRPATRRLVPARRACRHPEVVATGSPRPVRSEGERTPIERDTGRDVVGCRVERRAEIHRWRPGVVDVLPGGYPQIGSA